jgi:hypothetical protein
MYFSYCKWPSFTPIQNRGKITHKSGGLLN